VTTAEPYDVEWAPSALRSLEQLPEKITAAIVEFVFGALSDNPRRVGHELHFELEGKHSARRGDYRVVYEIDDERRVVVILAVDHRGTIYRSR
jgi:mRNA-degrading endonuclease RelE of RelBE toxin-antitoxin system